MINYFLITALVALAFGLKLQTPVDIRTGHQVLFALFAFLSLAIFGKPKLNFNTILVSSYFIIASFVLPVNFYATYSFFQWLLCSLWIAWFCQLQGYYLDRKIIFNGLAFLCLAQSFWIIAEALGFDIYGTFLSLFGEVQRVSKTGGAWTAGSIKQVAGSLGHPTISGAMITFTLPFVYKLRKYLVPIPLVAIYLTSSSMCVMGAALVLFYIIFKDKRMYALGALLTVGLFLYGHFYEGFFSNSARIAHWINLLKQYGLNAPIFGNGPGFTEVMVVSLEKGGEVLRPEHNEILSLYIQYGLVGIAIACCLLKGFVKKFINEEDRFLKAGILALAFNCLGNFPLHIASSSLLAMIFIVLLKGEKNGSIIS